jgi:hypothetical protein
VFTIPIILDARAFHRVALIFLFLVFGNRRCSSRVLIFRRLTRLPLTQSGVVFQMRLDVISADSSSWFAADSGKNSSRGTPERHLPTLMEIQIRAYRIHQQHGAINGGYTLDDWLEAEHELDTDLEQKRVPKKGRVQ